MVNLHLDRESPSLQNEEIYYMGEKKNKRHFRYEQDKAERQ